MKRQAFPPIQTLPVYQHHFGKTRSQGCSVRKLVFTVAEIVSGFVLTAF